MTFTDDILVDRLQALRISRLLDHPSEDLEPEHKAVLISQVLSLDWSDTQKEAAP